jgi:hypothetical protein
MGGGYQQGQVTKEKSRGIEMKNGRERDGERVGTGLLAPSRLVSSFARDAFRTERGERRRARNEVDDHSKSENQPKQLCFGDQDGQRVRGLDLVIVSYPTPICPIEPYS